MTRSIALNVNGLTARVMADDPNMPLLYALRNDLGLRGPRFGCGLGQCGACTVHMDGNAVRSCITPLSLVGDRSIVTLEGLGTPEKPHPMRDIATTRREFLKGTAALVVSFSIDRHQTARAQDESSSKIVSTEQVDGFIGINRK